MFPVYFAVHTVVDVAVVLVCCRQSQTELRQSIDGLADGLYLVISYC